MRLPLGILIAVLVAAPAVAHFSTLSYNTKDGYGFGYTRICNSGTTLYPVSKVCAAQTYNVPSGAVHVHNTFIFPYGGIATLEINLQEKTPVVGDFVTYYDRVCSTGLLPYTSSASVTCVGGQVRDWHTGITHKFIGQGSENACVPLYCYWAVAVHWS